MAEPVQRRMQHRPARRRPAGGGAADGFTLLELLLVVFLLVLIVVLLADLFAGADDLIARSTQRAHTDARARTALGVLRADLHSALIDSRLAFRARVGQRTYDFDSSELYCVSLRGTDVERGRSTRLVRFFVRPAETGPAQLFELVRAERPVATATGAAANAYWNTNWFDDAVFDATNTVPLAGHVTAFYVEAAPGAHAPGGDAPTHDYDSNALGPPRYLDVYLELLDRRAAREVADLVARNAPSNTWKDIIEFQARRYTTRIFPANVYGYEVP